MKTELPILTPPASWYLEDTKPKGTWEPQGHLDFQVLLTDLAPGREGFPNVLYPQPCGE